MCVLSVLHSFQLNEALLMLSIVVLILIILYKNGFTALMLASYKGKDDIVDLLINAKADVNVQDKKVSIESINLRYWI